MSEELITAVRDGQITVTCTDSANGESESQELKPDGYVLVCGEFMELAGEIVYRNGTRVLTLKRRAEPEYRRGGAKP